MEKEKLIQCYKVMDGSFVIAQMTKTKMKRERFYESPISALNDVLDSHKHNLINEELQVRKRKDIIEKLQKCLDDYYSGNDYILLDEAYKIF